jgi:hypothetical protein
MTPADISAAINAVKFIRSAVDDVIDVKDTAKYATLLRAITAADLAAATLETEMAEKIREINRLTTRVETLEAEKIKVDRNPVRSLIFKDGYYYDEGNNEGPFCSTCYDDKGKYIRLSETPGALKALGRWTCNACTSRFK